MANEKFLDVYGIEQIDITAIQSPKQRTARSTVTGLYEHVYEQLDAWCADVWSNFVRNKKMPDSLNEDDWVQLASAAPQTFEWLSELGRQLGQQLEKLRDMNFESMQRPVSAGTELSIVRMKQTFAASAHQGAMDRSAFTRCVKGLLGTESSKGFASALFHAVDVVSGDFSCPCCRYLLLCVALATEQERLTLPGRVCRRFHGELKLVCSCEHR